MQSGARPAPGAKPPDDTDSLISHSIARKEYRRALELLARAYAARLGRFCLAALGDQGEAEELVQEILLAAHGAMPRFEGRSAVRPWLYTIARRTCGHALQKRGRRSRLAVLQPLPAPPEDPYQLALARGQRERLRRALAELTPAAQEVLLLRYAGGLSFREVAEVCGIREDAARQRASSGLRLLRRELEELREDAPAPAEGAVCQEVSR